MRRRHRRWSQKYAFAGTFLIALIIFTDYVMLVLAEPSPLMVFSAILICVLFLPLGVSVVLDAFLWSFLDVYENGMTLPERKVRRVLRGEKEYFVPFSAIKGVITNSKNKAFNIAVYVGEKEIVIDKRDVYDLEGLERVLRAKVKYVWDTPPSDDVLEKAVGW